MLLVVAVSAVLALVVPSVSRALYNRAEPILVVSERPKALDAYYILNERENPKLTYVRGGTKFTDELENHFPVQPGEPHIRFYATTNSVVTGLIPAEVGRQRFARIHDQYRYSKEFPYPVVYICFGFVTGLFFTVGYGSVPALHMLVAAVSISKLLTSCPTCPTATIAGMNAALTGSILFSILAVFSLIWVTRKSVLIQAAVIGAALLWQIASWFQYFQMCLPCSIVGFVCGLQLAALSRMDFAIAIKPRHAFLKLAVVSGLSAIAGLAYMLSSEATGTIPARDLSGFSLPKRVRLTHARQLGLVPTGAKRTLLIAASRCQPCHKLLDAIQGFELDLEYFAYDREAPDAEHDWSTLPDSTNVSGTPLIIKVSEEGSIVSSLEGFSDDPAWLQRMFELLQE